jgi:hypothetical protein
LRKSFVLASAVLFSCALFNLVPTSCFAQGETGSSRLSAMALTPDPDADASSAPSTAPAGSPLPTPVPRRNSEGPRRIGVGAKISLLGIGGEAAIALTRRINVRGGFNFFNYSRGFDKDGINYGAQIAFRSAEAHLDWFPLGGFHLSPGLLFYNDNHIDATATVGAGQQFTLGGVSYSSDAANPVTGTAKLGFNKVAPTFLIGFGNLLPRNRRRFSLTTEFGVAYTGAPTASLNLAGTACTVPAAICVNAATDPTVQSNVQSEITKVNHDVSIIRFYPLASFGFGINF